MKALKILKAGEKALLKGFEIFGHEDEDTKKHLQDTQEAIAELEAMAQPKTCDRCKYSSMHDRYQALICAKNVGTYGSLSSNIVDYDFSCAYYEPKQPTKDKQ